MKPGRFLSMQRARSTYRAITSHLAAGGKVIVATYTKATIYSSVEQFKLGKATVYARRGKNWDAIDGCAIRFSR